MWVRALLLLCAVAACRSEPVIQGTLKLRDTYDRRGPYHVTTEARDPDGLDEVTLHFRPGRAQTVVRVMDEVRDGVFEAEIPGQEPDTAVEYFAMAQDGDDFATDPRLALSPQAARFSFRVLATACATTTDCGPNEVCDASRRCRQQQGACKTDSQCGKGFRCGAGGECRLAARACYLDEGCVTGEVCDQILDECVPRPECGGARTCPLDFACDAPSGLCRRACVGHADCGPGEQCFSGVCGGATTCQKAGDCPPHLTCDPLRYCRPQGAGLCAPCAKDADCGGPTDFCVLLDAGLFCGRDCSATPCPSGYTCSQSVTPAQCVPTSGSCPKK